MMADAASKVATFLKWPRALWIGPVVVATPFEAGRHGSRIPRWPVFQVLVTCSGTAVGCCG